MDIELIGKTVKGKNRIREHGKFAKITQESKRVFFTYKEGPWFYIKPHERWVHANDDPDFTIKKIFSY